MCFQSCGSRLGLREGILEPTEASRHTCTYKELLKHETFLYLFLEGQFGLPESEYTTLLKNVQYIICSIKNQIVLLAIVSICIHRQKNLDFAQINYRSPEEKKALLKKIPILKLGTLNFYDTYVFVAPVSTVKEYQAILL